MLLFIYQLFLDSVESFSSDSEKNYKSINDNKIDQSIEKKHNFVQKMIVIPEICGQCLKKLDDNLLICSYYFYKIFYLCI
jgi:hypothetical protein